MAACLLCPPTPSPHLHLLAGYEDGTVAVWDTGLPAALSPTSSCRKQPAPELVMQLKAHGEPLMALTASPTGTGESLSCCLCPTAMATSLVPGVTSQQHIGVQVPGLKHCCTTRVVNPTPPPSPPSVALSSRTLQLLGSIAWHAGRVLGRRVVSEAYRCLLLVLDTATAEPALATRCNVLWESYSPSHMCPFGT